MKVFKRLGGSGKESPCWYYSTVVKGQRVVRSTFETDKKLATAKAVSSVKILRDCRSAAAGLQSILDQHHPAVEETIRMRAVLDEYLARNFGCGPIKLKDAVARYEAKPDIPGPVYRKFAARFVNWMAVQHREALVLNDVKTSDIQGFLLKMKDDGFSGRSITMARAALKSLFRSLAKESKLEENVVGASKVPVVAGSTRKAFTVDEVREILRICSPLVRPVILLAASTGMRKKDCCLLRWGDVRLAEGVIVKTQCKTGRQVRIPLAAGAHQWLMVLKSEAVDSKDSAFVLPEAAKEYETSGGYKLNIKLLECLSRMGLEHNQTITGRYRKAKLRGWHSFRDFFLTTLANSNIPIHLVGQAAGHTSLAVTGTYLRTSGQTDEVVRKALPALDYEPTITVENQP